jgi:hypothetical protein
MRGGNPNPIEAKKAWIKKIKSMSLEQRRAHMAPAHEWRRRAFELMRKTEAKKQTAPSVTRGR